MRNLLSLVVSVCVVACVSPDASDEDSQTTESGAELSVDAAFGSSPYPVPPNGQAPCFNFWHTFIPGTQIRQVDWNGDRVWDECYGIAPDRTIWHAWPGHGWVKMPGPGLADNTLPAQLAGGNHRMVVYVAGPPASHWYTELLPSGWSSWFRCGSGQC
jgi:hypothetical protein